MKEQGPNQKKIFKIHIIYDDLKKKAFGTRSTKNSGLIYAFLIPVEFQEAVL